MHTDLRLAVLIITVFVLCYVLPMNDYTIPLITILLISCCVSTLTIVIKDKLIS